MRHRTATIGHRLHDHLHDPLHGVLHRLFSRKSLIHKDLRPLNLTCFVTDFMIYFEGDLNRIPAANRD